ncbi:MAG: hypothetical protein SGJ18_04995 [Pseudomonadota bacterium]|nr:hypothetical protein [Pseudomonadota bacterium]
MAINLKVEDDMQIVVFSGPLAEFEAQALRLKLDQKITQGRTKLLLNIALLDMKPEAINSILSFVDYAEQLKVSVAIAGLTPETWNLVNSTSGRRIHKFYTSEEAISHLTKTNSSYSVAHSNPALKNLSTEALELLEQYEAKRQKKNYDPFRLNRLRETYKTSPNKSHIKQLENAVAECAKSRSENGALEKDLTQLSQEMLRLTELRRSPVHYDEIELHTKNLNKLFTVVKKDIQEIKNQILTTTIISTNYSNQVKLVAQEYLKSIAELENKLSALKN